jgi:hypothetical protein
MRSAQPAKPQIRVAHSIREHEPETQLRPLELFAAGRNS